MHRHTICSALQFFMFHSAFNFQDVSADDGVCEEVKVQSNFTDGR